MQLFQPHKTISKFALVIAMVPLAITGCGENTDDLRDNDTDIEVVQDTGTFIATPPVDLDTEDWGSINPDVDLYGAKETTKDQLMASDRIITGREQPLDVEQQQRKEKVEMRQLAKDTRTEVNEFCNNQARLTDPIIDGPASFEQLDRDNNGSLSPAEFAVYDLSNINPMVKCDKNDGSRPFVSTKALNMSADDFVRFDENGDLAISKAEFTNMFI